MSRPSGFHQHAIVLALAVAALFIAAGCTIFTDSGVDRVLTGLYTGYAFRCIASPNPTPFGQGTIQAYTINADGSLTPADAPVNGEDCTPSTDDDGRANTVTEVSDDNIFNSSQGLPVTKPQSSRQATQSLFGYVIPLPFGPSFSPDDANKLTPRCTAGGAVYIVNHMSATVTKFGLCPTVRSKKINVGSNPLQAALTPDGRTLLVTRYDNAVVFIDTRTDSIIATMNTGALYPNGIAISPDGTRAYVTNYFDINSQVFVIDIASRKIIGNVLTDSYPKSVFLTPDGSQLWVLSYRSPTINIIDTLSMTVSSRITVGGSADIGMVFDPSGTRAYIGVGPDRISVIDTATLDEVTRIPLGFYPSDMAASPDGSRIFVNSWTNGSIAAIDTATNKVLKTTTEAGRFSMGLTLYQ